MSRVYSLIDEETTNHIGSYASEFPLELLDGAHGQEQTILVVREAHKTVALVKGAGGVIFSVDHDSHGTYLLADREAAV